MAPTFDDVSKSKYLLLTTFTKDGRPKPTPSGGSLTAIGCWSSPTMTRGR